MESVSAPSFAVSFLSSQSSSFVCRAEAMMATEPGGAFFNLSAISLSAAVQVVFSAANQNVLQPVVAANPFVIQPAGIAHPQALTASFSRGV